MNRLHPTVDAEPQAIRAAVNERGLALCRAPTWLTPELAARSPFEAAERLLGESPVMVERQPIKAVPDGRSFASTSGVTPLHTDSQLFRGSPPHAQIMLCARRAAAGGESTFVDGFALLEHIEQRDPDLLEALFASPRRMRFVFGDVLGPTVALRGGCLTITHPPFLPDDDRVGKRLQEHLASFSLQSIPIETGELFVADNHRMLHGRHAFDDPDREFVRLLVWLARPLSHHERFFARASAVAARLAPSLAGLTDHERRLSGQAPPADPEAERRLSIVMAMLRGVPPGVLARRHDVPEATLYAWRDEALAAATSRLGRLAPPATPPPSKPRGR